MRLDITSIVGTTGVTGYYFWHNCILWNSGIHFHSHREPSLFSNPNEINLINTLPSCFSYIHVILLHIFQVFPLSSVFPLRTSYEILFCPTLSYWQLLFCPTLSYWQLSSSICKPYSSTVTSAPSHFSFPSAIQNWRISTAALYNFWLLLPSIFWTPPTKFALRILIF